MKNPFALFTQSSAKENIFQSLARFMETSRQGVGVLFISINSFNSLKQIDGQENLSFIVNRVNDIINSLNLNFWGIGEKVASLNLEDGDFLFFFGLPERKGNVISKLETFCRELEQQFNLISGTGLARNIHIGYSEINCYDKEHLESDIYTAVKRAALMAKDMNDMKQLEEQVELGQIINQRKIRVVYQPIISLKDGSIFGYEALCRGPEGFFSSPVNLFTFAERFNMASMLDNLCHEEAINNSLAWLGQKKLFLNVIPSGINRQGSGNEKVKSILERIGMQAANIVLELTERSSIADYQSFRKLLKHFRLQGYLLAIDDSGAGYSSLQSISELQPEFIKIDISLIQGVDKNITKRALLEMLKNFADKINAKVIAEGIETVDELKALIDIGIDFGQGYLIARPSGQLPKVSIEALNTIKAQKVNQQLYFNSGFSVADILIYQEPLPATTFIPEVVEFFQEFKNINGVVIGNRQKVEGLVMKQRLFSILGTRYGYVLFENKPISKIMDKSPLIIPKHTLLESAAQLAAARNHDHFDDFIIVADELGYHGIVSVSKLLQKMAEIQIENAREANPLTGLPGNKCIERVIKERLNNGLPLTCLYLDLDNFKAFNDKYGFERGDEVIKFTADILRSVLKKQGKPEDFLGHIGGDDFVIVTDWDRAEIICQEVIKSFDESIHRFYDDEVLQTGYFISFNREGKPEKFSVMSISIGAVSTKNMHIKNYLEMGEIAAELKHCAKNFKGSNYCFDRRKC